MSEKETLISTLIKNGLASSRSEAQRMADSMISTSDKVNASMREVKDNFMISNYKQREKVQSVEPIAQTAPQEEKIAEMRQNAINPQAVHVQTEFDTPANDQEKTQWSQEPETFENNQTQEEITTQPAQEITNQITPEEYAAQQMNSIGATNVNDLTSAPKPIEISTSQLETGFPQETQTPQAEQNTGDFISQEPSLEQQPNEKAQESLESTPFPTPKPIQSNEMSSQKEEPAPVKPQEEQAIPQKEPENKSRFTAEEQKLADDVDLSKVFNFSNK